MAKIVSKNIITSEKGVSQFYSYCCQHKPFIIWREETKNDFGIDGEIELTYINSENKVVATGEIKKIQIKSTDSWNSYIQNETKKSFNFYARNDDIEYWKKHKTDVILVIYDVKNNILYAKNVNCLNLNNINKNNKVIINFDKIKNKLEFGKNDLFNNISKDFKERVSHLNTEQIVGNIFKLELPEYIYIYETNFTNKEHNLEINSIPEFIIKSNLIYTFYDLNEEFKDFYKNITNYKITKKPTNDLIKNYLTRPYISELINLHIKNYLKNFRIEYDDHFKRYYFLKNENEDNRYEEYISKTGLYIPRKVVSFYQYIKNRFYVHFGFEIDCILGDEQYLIINSKYLYTKDGKEKLEGDKVIRYIQLLKSTEFNQTCINHLHFIQNFISKNNIINISNSKNFNILINNYKIFDVNFGIDLDYHDKTNPIFEQDFELQFNFENNENRTNR